MGSVKGRERRFMERHVEKEMRWYRYQETAMPS